MKIAIGADHAGVELKQRVRRLLERAGHEVRDLGTEGTESVDYPDFAHAVARAVQSGEAERGVLVCGTGIGMSIAANKVDGIRAAKCNDPLEARMARAHNDANVLCLGARVLDPTTAEETVTAFLGTDFEAGRHARRVDRLAPGPR
ncbi:MAG: ribose 5-phosphate isomerase B [Planctomycetota bacterium]|jgi:ribose 5-phosphate isomerase B